VLTFQTAPSGLALAVGGTTSVTPFTRTVIVNSANSISAPSPQTLGGTTYAFSSWSDGGAATHNVTAPAVATTYTATYTQQTVAPPVSTTAPSVSGPPKQGKGMTTSDGGWSGATPMTFTYRWLRCDQDGANCVPISGATASTYILTAADVDFRIRSEVTATNGGGSAGAQSSATAVIKKGR
jgi:hypothetical protein